MGWISDLFRLAGAFLYWNARKSIYRLRGAQGRCPCQHPSDSGRAWETACAAVTHWAHPARFRRVCPLLKQNASGAWRCSVNRADVRPFWRRAAIFYGSTLLAFYLAVTLGVFIFLRSVGYAVTYPGVLWPPAWENFTAIRSDFFLEKYQASAKSGDMQAALMALSTAYNLDPQNYAAGRRLASLWQMTQPLYSDQIYNRLLADHPAEAETTAQVWFRALLARGDFKGIETLATDRLLASPAASGAWLNAWLFAHRRTAGTASRARLLAAPALTPTGRLLITLTGDLAAALSPADQQSLLRNAAAAAGDGLAFYHVCREFTARGFAQDTLDWMDRRPGLLGPRDMLALRLDALAALGWRATLRSEIAGLLIEPPAPVLIELVAAHLIRHPDAGLLDMLFARVDQAGPAADEAGFRAYFALFCAAGAGRDETRLRWTATRINQLLGDEFRGLDTIGIALLDTKRTRHLANYLPALQPLGLDVTYALFDHYDPVL
jgi:hypothetical protein